MIKIYDVAIVGSGPAGIEAGINLKIKNKTCIIFGNKFLNKKLIKGHGLKETFLKHLNDMQITTEKVNNIYNMGSYFALMVNNKIYQGKSVIIATGVDFSKSIKGEGIYLGRGVSYSGKCDAHLYKDRTVAVVGYNEGAEDETKYVSEIVKKVYYISMYKKDICFSEDNIEVIRDVPIQVQGDIEVKKLIMEKGEISINGVFFLRDSISPSQLVKGLDVKNEHIVVGRKMETNIKGMYAAGDCTGKPYQYMKACGEGKIAALNIAQYLG